MMHPSGNVAVSFALILIAALGCKGSPQSQPCPDNNDDLVAAATLFELNRTEESRNRLGNPDKPIYAAFMRAGLSGDHSERVRDIQRAAGERLSARVKHLASEGGYLLRSDLRNAFIEAATSAGVPESEAAAAYDINPSTILRGVMVFGHVAENDDFKTVIGRSRECVENAALAKQGQAHICADARREVAHWQTTAQDVARNLSAKACGSPPAPGAATGPVDDKAVDCKMLWDRQKSVAQYLQDNQQKAKEKCGD